MCLFSATALSELGRRAYLAFWSATLARYITANIPNDRRITVKEISEGTYILPDDVIATLKDMNVLERVGGNRCGDGADDDDGGDGIGGNYDQVDAMKEDEGVDSDESSSVDSSSFVINKASVRAWMGANGISREAPVDGRYFRDGR